MTSDHPTRSSDDLNDLLHGLPGPHPGPGSITNIGAVAEHIGTLTVHQETRRRDVLDSAELPRDALLAPPHVEVDSWSEAWSTGSAFLSPHGAVGVMLVIARQGCGSSAFVRQLCAEKSPENTTILDLEPEWDSPSVSRLPLEPNRVHILELKSPTTDLPTSGFLDRLALFGEQLAQQESRLIVTFTEQLWEPVDGWQHPRVPVLRLHTAPDPQRLVEAHLGFRGRAAAVPYVRTPTARALLRGMNAVEAVRAVGTVVRQWDARPVGPEYPVSPARRPNMANLRRHPAPQPEPELDPELSARIESALGDWRVELDRLFNDIGTDQSGSSLSLRLRCLLVSLAVHRAAPAQVIDQDALALEAALARASPGDSYREPTIAALFSGQGLRSRLMTLSAQVDLHDQVVFDRPGYTESVLVYVWDNFTQLRSVLLQWLVRLPVRDRSASDPAARALAELIRRHKDIDRLDETRRVAVEAGRTALLAEVTVRVLADEHMRRGVWQLMTGWARTPSGPGLAVVDVCRSVLQDRDGRPQDRKLAMTRLRYLAQHAEGSLRERLLALLDDLAGEELPRALLVGEVDTWLTRDRPGHLGRLALLALLGVPGGDGAGPWLLSSPEPLPVPLLTRGLSELLAAFDRHPEAVPRAAAWLHPAPAGEVLDRILGCLATGLSASAEASPSLRLMSTLTELGEDTGRLQNLLFRRMVGGTPQGGHPEWGDRPAERAAVPDQPVYGP
ncbi:hypothetical protein [Kitasatospora phosalacinea]|uniref:Uncharacterized protein n=1 Tax=Kitasatospora phosalacinea TaxID=2065 RepID=A0A9W6PD22_9ACTN|nr:hypothetical protein [Kitasatospora phosalacinea]GLW52870.1 hypothetical protein Kpho01_08810 [Kitasatospora phosalacinea]